VVVNIFLTSTSYITPN